MKNTTPKLRKETKVVKIHNDKLTDDYAWIKQDNWQEVLQKPQVLNSEVLNYLKEENKFTDTQLEDQKLSNKQFSKN